MRLTEITCEETNQTGDYEQIHENMQDTSSALEIYNYILQKEKKESIIQKN